MEASSYLHLHQEHRNWLSQIDFWIGEIAFLKGACKKLTPGNPNLYEFNHKLDHLSRWLENMKLQIDSHERFLKEAWGDFPESLEVTNMEDHKHNRDHMDHFQEAIKQLKGQIFYQLNQNTTSA